MADDPLAQAIDPDSVLSLLLEALDDGTDDRRSALLLRWAFLSIGADRQDQTLVCENV